MGGVTHALAHVVVKPAEVGVSARQNFVVSVPTEEDIPTIQIRLIVPEGLKSVRPNVKPGWNIELVKSDEDKDARVSEIIWSGGSIPAEQRDEFVFSAQAPAEETSLNWKAYQTHEGGKVVSWDNDPKVVEEYTKQNPPKEGDHDENAPKPFSQTKVLNDLEPDISEHIEHEQKANNAFLLSIFAVVLAAGALGLQFYKKK